MTNPSPLVDIRDGHIYNTVNINGLTWMAENFSGLFGNNFTTSDDSVYGRFYDWASAVANAPTGWRLPTSDELNSLCNFVNYVTVSLKAKSGLWVTNTGTDIYGFSALPAGSYIDWAGDIWSGSVCDFWSSTTTDQSNTAAYGLSIGDEAFQNPSELSVGYSGVTVGYSVRYVKDVFDPGASFTLDSVIPSLGTTWNRTVTVSGTSMLSSNNIYFDGTPITDFISKTDTSASILLPLKSPGTYNFTIG